MGIYNLGTYNSRETDLGSGPVHTWASTMQESTLWEPAICESRESTILDPLISDLDLQIHVLQNKYNLTAADPEQQG